MIHCVLLADANSILRIAIFLIVVASWLLKQIFGTPKKEVPQPRRAGGRAAADRPPRPPKVRPQGETNLNKEIEEFLERAAQRRGAKGRRETAVAAAAAPPAGKQPVRRLVQAPPTLDPAPLRAVPLGAGVAQHVEQHLATQEFNVRAAHLADDVVRAEQEMQQHLTKAFSHQVGRLADTSRQATEDKETAAAAVAKAAAPAAASLATLLADANSLRQAIILNEILQRPEHRW